MSTLRNEKLHRGVNPVVRKLSNISKISDKNATYKGIAFKTIYFLVAIVVGFMGYYLVSKHLAVGKPIMLGDFVIYVPQLILAILALQFVVVVPCIAWRISNKIKFVGTLSCMAQGFLIAWVTNTFAGELNEGVFLYLIVVFALLISLLMMYKHKLVKFENKVKLVILAVILTAGGSSIALFIAYFIPNARPYVNSISNNTALVYVVSLVITIIMALLLMCDFNYIDKCIKNSIPEKYEWLASFGLAFSVVWIAFKVIDLFTKTKEPKI